MVKKIVYPAWQDANIDRISGQPDIEFDLDLLLPFIVVQGGQLDMTVFFWYLVKIYFFTVHFSTHVH